MSANSSFDGFTAGVLLSATQQSSNREDVYKLFKSLQNADAGPPEPDIVKFIEARIGKSCTIKYASHKGVVTGVNIASRGFYPGSRYPVVVKITDSSMIEAIGEVFEYGLDQVEFEE